MWWKIYFWILLILNVLGLFAFLEITPLAIIDLISIFTTVLLLIALWSFIYKKKVLNKKYWNIIFWVFIFMFAEEMIEIYLLPKNFITDLFPFLQSGIKLTSVERLSSWIISLPAIYSIYKLSGKNK